MAVDKLVDSTQLNSDLTSVANAIRTKGGTSAQLAFPAEFVSAIGNIQSGYAAADWLNLTKPTGRIESDVAMNSQYGYREVMRGRSGITSVFLSEATYISDDAFTGCTGLLTFVGKKVNTVGSTAIGACTHLTGVDLGGTAGTNQGLKMSAFSSDSALNVLVLRSTNIVPLANVNAFQSTPFANGGAGGTIYIPKTLYDALGTGTNDYKAASNWSTVDGYGTITWAKIEGSTYETHYVDGTAIPTT